MANKPEQKFEITLNEINAVVGKLSQMPFNQVHEIITFFQTTVRNQTVQAAASTAKPAETKTQTEKPKLSAVPNKKEEKKNASKTQ